MAGYCARWLTAVAGAGLLAGCLSAVATAPGRARADVTALVGVRIQPGAHEVGNLLNYADSDFEGTTGAWVGGRNAKLSDDTSVSFLHHDSLLDRAPARGTSSFRIRDTHPGIKIILHPGRGGAKYRVGAYFKTSGLHGATVRFSLGCWNSAGSYLGERAGRIHKLLSIKKWQYREDDIWVPAGCAYVRGSPKVALGGLPANAAVAMDEVIFAPYRAAVIIGAKGQRGLDGLSYYDAQDWVDTNNKIGPLQSDKDFYGGNSPTLPGQWNDPLNTCYQVEQLIGTGNRGKWPACVINLADFEPEARIQDFFTGQPRSEGLPAAQMVIMIFHGEPESKKFGCPVPHPPASRAARYVCSFKLESRNIRRAAAAVGDVPNVFVASDSSTYYYGGGLHDRAGRGCAWIPPTGYTDFYLADHYDQHASGNKLPDENPYSAHKWSNWLSCIKRFRKPIGLAEYGLNCTSNPNRATVTHEMAADGRYLAAIPHATGPTIMWEYWYSDNRNDPPGCVFNNSGIYKGRGGITQWKSGARLNGGG
jgi:hypothetical protein